VALAVGEDAAGAEVDEHQPVAVLHEDVSRMGIAVKERALEEGVVAAAQQLPGDLLRRDVARAEVLAVRAVAALQPGDELLEPDAALLGDELADDHLAPAPLGEDLGRPGVELRPLLEVGTE